MRRSRLLPWASAPLVAALLLTGCGGGGTPDSATDQDVSPLEEYTNAIFGIGLDPQEEEDRMAADLTAREELVAQCMSEEGFEYIPQEGRGMFVGFDEDAWKPDDREWVAQWGYGAIEYPGKDDRTLDDMPEDPNQEYVSSLSESESDAYYEALFGPAPSEDELAEDVETEYDWETAGCSGFADHELSKDDPTTSEQFAPLREAMSEFWERSMSAPELAEVDAEWSDCMDAAGYPGFVQQLDAQTSIYDKVSGLYETPEESGPDEAAMSALHDEEVELALVDLDCRESTDYRERARKIQWALEEAFVADHKDELEAAKAAAEQADS